MSSVVVITPIIIGSWPAISAVLTATVSALGFSVVQATATSAVSGQVKGAVKEKATIEVEDSEILQHASATGEVMVVERDGLRATFSRDGRGALKLCVEGEGYTKAELKQAGQELIERVTQQYVYHRVVTELKERNMIIADEEVSADRTVKIRVKNV